MRRRPTWGARIGTQRAIEQSPLWDVCCGVVGIILILMIVLYLIISDYELIIQGNLIAILTTSIVIILVGLLIYNNLSDDKKQKIKNLFKSDGISPNVNKEDYNSKNKNQTSTKSDTEEINLIKQIEIYEDKINYLLDKYEKSEDKQYLTMAVNRYNDFIRHCLKKQILTHEEIQRVQKMNENKPYSTLIKIMIKKAKINCKDY